ncbi:MAG: hypothetical protein ACJ75J_02420 [Cytophagaceae bacterium]
MIKSLHFFTLLFFFSHLLQAQLDNYFIESYVDLNTRPNRPFYCYNREIPTILIDGLKEGKIVAYEASGIVMSQAQALDRLIIYEDTMNYYDEMMNPYASMDIKPFNKESLRKFSASDLRRISVMSEISASGIVPRWIDLLLENISYQESKDSVLLRFKFEDCSALFKADKRAVWYNRQNNADSLNYADALKGRLYTTYALRILKNKNAVFDTKIMDTTASFENPYLRRLIQENAGKVNNLKERGMGATGTAFKMYYDVFISPDMNNKYGIPLMGRGREVTRILIDGVLDKKITPYNNQEEILPLTIEEFKKRMEAEEIMANEEMLDPGEIQEYTIIYTSTSYLPEGLAISISEKSLAYSEKREDKVKFINLFIPASNPDNLKGIDMPIATFRLDECIGLFNKDPRAMWYNPDNNADSCTYSKAITDKKFMVSYLMAENIFREPVISIGANWQNPSVFIDYNLPDSIVINSAFLRKTSSSPVLEEYKKSLRNFKDYLPYFDSLNYVPESCRSKKKKLFFKYSAYRSIDFRKSPADKLFQKGREFSGFVMKEILKGGIPAYDYDNRLLTGQELQSVIIRLDTSYSPPDTIYDYSGKHKSNVCMVGLEERLVISGTKKKFSPQYAYLICPADYNVKGIDLFLFKIKYSDFLKIISEAYGRKSEEFALIKSKKYDSSIDYVTDLFGRDFYLNDSQMKDPLIGKLFREEIAKALKQ